MSEGYTRKRARTRRALLIAGMATLAERGPEGATVGEIAGRAHVATGTFYNHFPSIGALTEAIVDELAAGVAIASDVLSEIEGDPAVRVVIGTRQLLGLGRDDPATARAFVSLLASIPELRSRIRDTVRGAVHDGIEAGRFRRSSASATADALLGAVVQWMRSRLAGEHDDEPEAELLAIALDIVGLPATDVDAVIELARTHDRATVVAS